MLESMCDMVREYWLLGLVLSGAWMTCVGCVAMTVGVFLLWRQPVTIRDGVRKMWAVMNGQ